MQTTLLGKSGIRVPRIGLGTATFGREIDEKSSFEILDYAVDRGINLLDTAESYGGGQAREYRRNLFGVDDVREVSHEWHSSEKIIGRWLRATGRRSDILLVSKITTNFTRKHVREALQASLERLQTNYIDVYLFHSFDATTSLLESLEAMHEAQRSGLIRAAGCSNFNVDQVRDALTLGRQFGLQRIQAVEGVCNLAAREAENELLPLSLQEHLGFLAYSPLGAGFLTGKYLPNTGVVPPGSRFHVIPGHADLYFNEQNFGTLKDLQTFAEKCSIAPQQLAIAWVLAHSAVSTVLCGARSTMHVDNAIAALQLELSAEWHWPASLAPIRERPRGN